MGVKNHLRAKFCPPGGVVSIYFFENSSDLSDIFLPSRQKIFRLHISLRPLTSAGAGAGASLFRCSPRGPTPHRPQPVGYTPFSLSRGPYPLSCIGMYRGRIGAYYRRYAYRSVSCVPGVSRAYPTCIENVSSPDTFRNMIRVRYMYDTLVIPCYKSGGASPSSGRAASFRCVWRLR